jgi:hypothetical protein
VPDYPPSVLAAATAAIRGQFRDDLDKPGAPEADALARAALEAAAPLLAEAWGVMADEIAEGYERVAVEEGPGWRTETGRQCSHIGPRHRRCPDGAVAAVQDGTERKMWFRACPKHMRGRWIEDGKIMVWILRKIPDA